MNDQGLVHIGRIAGTYGFNGVLRVEMLTDFPERFQCLSKVKVEYGDRIQEYSIASVQLYKSGLLLKLDGIDSKEEAAHFRNAYLAVEEDELYPLPPGYYYRFQLVGLEVFDEEKGYLGPLTSILETGANDVYVVRSELYGEILIPAIRQVILQVDLERKQMRVKLLPGLIDRH